MKSARSVAAEFRAALTDKRHPDHEGLMRLLTDQAKKIAPHAKELRKWADNIRQAEQEAIHLLTLFKKHGMDAINKYPSISPLTFIAALSINDEEARHLARQAVASNAAGVRHSKRREAINYVRAEWMKLKDSNKRANKTKFVEEHMNVVVKEFGIEVSEKVMRDRWLRNVTP